MKCELLQLCGCAIAVPCTPLPFARKPLLRGIVSNCTAAHCRRGGVWETFVCGAARPKSGPGHSNCRCFSHALALQHRCALRDFLICLPPPGARLFRCNSCCLHRCCCLLFVHKTAHRLAERHAPHAQPPAAAGVRYQACAFLSPASPPADAASE